ncbi:MAG: T9SS type A sorting domain-containing protein [Muribaculaceae bacterium]|nr:T9SS type A sorting domain-containing protein [Muribaculaceae bacterium]
MKEVIRRAGVSDINVEAETMIRWTGRNVLEIFSPSGVTNFDVYNVSGHRVRTLCGSDDTLICDLNDLSAGTYIIRINNSDTQRIIIK